MGLKGASLCLRAGANEIGGTLMNESITRAAGAKHGQEMKPAILESTIRSCQRQPFQRNTLYEREHAHNAELPAAKLENYG